MSQLIIKNKARVYQCVPPSISVVASGTKYTVSGYSNSRTNEGMTLYLRNSTTGKYLIPFRTPTAPSTGKPIPSLPYVVDISEFIAINEISNGDILEFEIDTINYDCPNPPYENNVVLSNTVTFTVVVNTCKEYTFGYGGGQPGDTGMIKFIDCDNIERTINMTWEESDGRYYETTVCAKQILDHNQFANDITNYQNQPNC